MTLSDLPVWKKKWLIFAFVMIAGVGVDQFTKLYAEARLATIDRDWEHEVVVKVDDGSAGKPLKEYLTTELDWSNAEEVERVAKYFSYDAQSRRLRPDTKVEAGQEIHIKNRRATVVEGYFDLVYARNPGAAWSFMANAPETFRKTFFRLASFLALIVIVVMLAKAENRQQRLIWALSLVASGAVGNLIDRVAYGYVIDFIVWRVNEHRWPTFNIADAWISIGVGLMFIELALGYRDEAQDPDASSDDKKDDAAASEAV